MSRDDDVGLWDNPEPDEHDDADEARDDHLADVGWHGED